MLNMLKIAYETAKKHFGEERPKTQEYKQNYLYVKNEVEGGSSVERFDIKEEATFTDLLYLSKFIAYYNEEEEISIASFINALGFIELNALGKEVFSQLIELEQLNTYTNAKEYIEQAHSLPKKEYDEQLKEVVKKLKEIFGDKPIGTLR